MGVYDRNQRYLLCDHCGAPVQVQIGGGAATCGHCRAPLEVRMRPEAAVAPPRAGSEGERVGILASQERSFVPPPDIAVLFAGDRVAVARERDAMQQWGHLRGRLRAGYEYEAGRRLFFLTIGLCELLFERGDLLRQRALAESALTVLPNATQQQVLNALLARSALRAGDAPAAEAWLALCNPRSEDLLADTAFRFARAYLDTARSSFSAVVHTLGAASIPLSDAYAPECAVLCANAWERLGEVPTAVDVLLYLKRELGPLAARRGARFIRAHAQWRLCPRSEHDAQRRADAMQSQPWHGAQIATLILFTMGVYSLLWAAGGIALPFLSLFVDLDIGLGGSAMSVLGGGIMGVLLTPISIAMWFRNRADHKLHLRGVPHVAHILGRNDHIPPAEPGGFDLRLELLVTPDDAPAYRLREEVHILREMLPNFTPGRTLIIRVDPRNSARFELEVPRPVSA